DLDNIFAPPKNPTTLLLSANREPDNTTLLEYWHYQPEDLVKLLFLLNAMCLGKRGMWHSSLCMFKEATFLLKGYWKGSTLYVPFPIVPLSYLITTPTRYLYVCPAVGSTCADTMADMNMPANDVPAEQAPAIAPPTRTDDQILPSSKWVPIGKSNCVLDVQKS
ncbi:hypothetical protein Tco_1059834, partial [Tanacetum coccineum]